MTFCSFRWTHAFMLFLTSQGTITVKRKQKSNNVWLAWNSLEHSTVQQHYALLRWRVLCCELKRGALLKHTYTRTSRHSHSGIHCNENYIGLISWIVCKLVPAFIFKKSSRRKKEEDLGAPQDTYLGSELATKCLKALRELMWVMHLNPFEVEITDIDKTCSQ